MAKPHMSAYAMSLPPRPVEHLTRPLAHFLHIESASGIVLLACTIAALVLANSDAASDYHKFWKTPIYLTIGTFKLGGGLGHFVVNDVLMTIFFFVVGLEIKRELVAGELRDRRKAALPVAAAIGGMIFPATVYAVLQAKQFGEPAFRGWGIPMATDIAFVLGVLALLGKRVPIGLKILLLSLAIADDIGAVIVIAVFYSTGMNWTMLALAGVGFVVVTQFNRLGVRAVPVYFVVGMFIWVAAYKSGIHPTVIGVLLGLLTPPREWLSRDTLRLALTDLAARLGEKPTDATPGELKLMSFAARESVPPLERLELALHPWVGFVIMPLFALANAGVRIEASAITAPVSVAVGLGLVIGKPAGVILFSFLAVKFGLARLPKGVSWLAVLGGGFLAGIGFTMSLFVSELAFGEYPSLNADSKIGILLGSLVSALVGATLLLLALRRQGEPSPAAPEPSSETG